MDMIGKILGTDRDVVRRRASPKTQAMMIPAIHDTGLLLSLGSVLVQDGMD
jgi:hypothetical protein